MQLCAQTEPGVDCYTAYHAVFMVLAIITIVGVSVGMPVFLFVWLRRLARPLHAHVLRDLKVVVRAARLWVGGKG